MGYFVKSGIKKLYDDILLLYDFKYYFFNVLCEVFIWFCLLILVILILIVLLIFNIFFIFLILFFEICEMWSNVFLFGNRFINVLYFLICLIVVW